MEDGVSRWLCHRPSAWWSGLWMAGPSTCSGPNSSASMAEATSLGWYGEFITFGLFLSRSLVFLVSSEGGVTRFIGGRGPRGGAPRTKEQPDSLSHEPSPRYRTYEEDRFTVVGFSVNRGRGFPRGCPTLG